MQLNSLSCLPFCFMVLFMKYLSLLPHFSQRQQQVFTVPYINILAARIWGIFSFINTIEKSQLAFRVLNLLYKRIDFSSYVHTVTINITLLHTPYIFIKYSTRTLICVKSHIQSMVVSKYGPLKGQSYYILRSGSVVLNVLCNNFSNFVEDIN